jgi:hypothetical protein
MKAAQRRVEVTGKVKLTGGILTKGQERGDLPLPERFERPQSRSWGIAPAHEVQLNLQLGLREVCVVEGRSTRKIP